MYTDILSFDNVVSDNVRCTFIVPYEIAKYKIIMPVRAQGAFEHVMQMPWKSEHSRAIGLFCVQDLAPLIE